MFSGFTVAPRNVLGAGRLPPPSPGTRLEIRSGVRADIEWPRRDRYSLAYELVEDYTEQALDEPEPLDPEAYDDKR